MKNLSFHDWRRAACALALCAPLAAAAACSRDIVVPVAPIGASVVIKGDSVSGIYPELLRSLGARIGCNFLFPVVPRARLEAMFETGKADLLIPASSTPRRDRHGSFVPLIGSRAVLISVNNTRPPVRNAQELIDRHELRVALVRGFDYGDAYQALVQELGRQGRLFFEVDTVSVARLLQGGHIDATIMAPTILTGAVQGDPRVEGLAERLRLEALPELPWGYSGGYLSRTALTPADSELLRGLLERAARSGVVFEHFQRYYPAEILSSGIRPR